MVYETKRKKKRCKLGKRGVITLYIVFLVTAIFLVLIGAFAGPFGARFSTEAYQMGDDLIRQSNESISSIQDNEVRTRIQGIFSDALDNTESNIDISTGLFKYSWVMLIGLTALIVFLFTRGLVETRGGLV